MLSLQNLHTYNEEKQQQNFRVVLPRYLLIIIGFLFVVMISPTSIIKQLSK